MHRFDEQFPITWTTFLRFSNAMWLHPSDLIRTPEAHFRLLMGGARARLARAVSWWNNGARNPLDSPPTTDSTFDFDRDRSRDGPWTFLYCCQVSNLDMICP